MKIADSLQGYYQLKDGTGLVYTKGNADEGFDVCGVSYNNPTEEVFLADGMTDVMWQMIRSIFCADDMTVSQRMISLFF